MTRFPNKQSVLEGILKAVSNNQSIGRAEIVKRDPFLYNATIDYFFSYYTAIEEAAKVKSQEFTDKELREMKKDVLKAVRFREKEGFSLIEDYVEVDHWQLYWQACVAFGTYDEMIETLRK